MSILVPEFSHVHADSLADTTDAWLLGYALGRHTEQSEPPGGYSPDLAASFQEGWITGHASRRIIIGPMVAHPYPDDPANDDLAALNGDDHDGQFDPNDLEYWTVADAEFREISEGFTRYPGEIEASRVLGHRATAAQEGWAA